MSANKCADKIEATYRLQFNESNSALVIRRLEEAFNE